MVSVEGRFNFPVARGLPGDFGVPCGCSGVVMSLAFAALSVEAAVARANDGTAMPSLT